MSLTLLSTQQNSRRLLFSAAINLLLLTLLNSPQAFAHRGPADEIDNCRIRVGTEKIHFSAYTPTFSQGASYCQFIPHIGPTNLVFDYEGQKLRNVSVEFEITKEPEGTRVFYQEPTKIKSGTLDTLVDFSQHGGGDYLAHITIMHEGEKLDTHLPFAIGVEEEHTPGWVKVLIPLLFIVAVLVFMMRGAKSNAQKQD